MQDALSSRLYDPWTALKNVSCYSFKGEHASIHIIFFIWECLDYEFSSFRSFSLTAAWKESFNICFNFDDSFSCFKMFLVLIQVWKAAPVYMPGRQLWITGSCRPLATYEPRKSIPCRWIWSLLNLDDLTCSACCHL